MKQGTIASSSVVSFIAAFPPAVRKQLEALRALIQEVAPNADEQMSYGMPAYKLHGKPLVYFSAYEHHIGLYATPAGQAGFAAELTRYKQGKGSIQFPVDEPLPLSLIRRIVAARAVFLDEMYGHKKKAE